MRKALALVVIAIVAIAFALMLWSLVFGEEPALVCEKMDYECNFGQYMDDISRRPPDFSQASALAIDTSAAINQTISKIMTLSDYEASSMIRVLLAYPASTQRRICGSSGLMEQLRSRSEDISSPYQREEFDRLLSQLNCT